MIGAAVPALEAAGCDTPRLDAEVLAADALGVERGGARHRPGRAGAAAGRAGPPGGSGAGSQREPVAYIVGRKGFRHIDLAVDSRALIPRPDTELLVEVALELPERRAVHDVGTGSGAVALALLDERPDLRVSASDSSAPAVDLARDNAHRLGAEIEIARFEGLPPGEYDLVVANLPYVREDEWAGLEPEITRYEPREALVSGADGLDAIRAWWPRPRRARRWRLEHGPDQGPAVRALLRTPRPAATWPAASA